MTPGQSRFNYFFNQLQPLLTAASNQRNPALWLYRNDARTPLFMLEALAKMYESFHDKKIFSKLRAHIKLVEDALGAIDYYDTIAKDLVSNKVIPAPVTTYLQAQVREKIQSLNEILSENDWLLPEDNRIMKIQKKLRGADWMDEEDEAEEMKDFYGESINKIIEFTQRTNFKFADIELEVHELRRKLRWLSIYPQAVRGAIQLEKSLVLAKHLKKYCIKEIVTSPFNKMPDKGRSKFLLLLEQDHFYALSWLIAALGKIKDEGLHSFAVKEALQQTSAISDEEAYKKTYRMLGIKQPKMEELLARAGNISRVFFQEQNLEQLVIGIIKVT